MTGIRHNRQPSERDWGHPVVSLEEDGLEHEALLAESVGLTLLVVLEALTPAERLAFALHDVFGVPFADIATALDRFEAAAQQLASRARRRVRESRGPDADLARQRRVVDAFFAASRNGGILRADASLARRGRRRGAHGHLLEAASVRQAGARERRRRRGRGVARPRPFGDGVHRHEREDRSDRRVLDPESLARRSTS
jgi:RNA polymerase sigma-70 factor (ECF subfamily)